MTQSPRFISVCEFGGGNVSVIAIECFKQTNFEYEPILKSIKPTRLTTHDTALAFEDGFLHITISHYKVNIFTAFSFDAMGCP